MEERVLTFTTIVSPVQGQKKRKQKTNLHKPDFSRKTTLSFNPQTETFRITRPSFPSASASPSQPNDSNNLINTTPELAPHTLFTTLSNTSETPKAETEPLTIHVFRDSSVLEVFVNGGRTAISTRLYAAEENLGIRFFVDEEADGEDADADADGCEGGTSCASELIHAQVWDGIGA